MFKSAHTLSARLPGILTVLRDPYLLAVLLIALVSLAAAYQFRYPFAVQVGGPVDGILLNNIHGPETEGAAKTPMRWTTGDSELVLHAWGAGNPVELDVALARWQPNDEVADLTLLVNGLEFARPQAAGQGRQEYRLPITDPKFLQGDDLSIKFESDSFIPKQTIPGSKDNRRLGIQLYSIQLTPLVAGNGSWQKANGLVFSPFHLPPADLSLYWLGSALALYLGLIVFKIPRRLALLVAAVALVAGTVALVAARPYLTLFAGNLLVILLISIGLGMLSRPLARRLLAWGGIRPTDLELNLLALVFALSCLVKLAFLLYPQTISFDLLYHIHRLEFILDGKFFWSIPSGKNEFGGQDVPYLPSYYIFLAPFAHWVSHDLLVQLSGILLDSVSIFFIYFLLKKHFDDGRAGLFAAWIYTVVPLTFIALSWGIYANIYGQFLTLLLVVALIEGLDRLDTLRGFVVIAALFTLTLLSHTSVFASIVPMFAVWGALLFLFGGMWRSRRLWAFVGSIAVASIIAFGSYYSHFLGLITGSTTTIVEAATDETTRNMGDQGLTFFQLLQPARTEFIAVPLWVYAVMALGFIGLIYLAWRSPSRGRFLLLTMLASWFVALAVLMYTRAEFGFSSRYVNFAMPAIALCAGVAFSWTYARGLLGRLVAYGLSALLAAQGAYHWYVLVFFKYH